MAIPFHSSTRRANPTNAKMFSMKLSEFADELDWNSLIGANARRMKDIDFETTQRRRGVGLLHVAWL